MLDEDASNSQAGSCPVSPSGPPSSSRDKLTPSISQEQEGTEMKDVEQVPHEDRLAENDEKDDNDETSTQSGGVPKKRRIDCDSGSDMGIQGAEEGRNILPSATVGPIRAASSDIPPEKVATNIEGGLPTPPATAQDDAESKMDIDKSAKDNGNLPSINDAADTQNAPQDSDAVDQHDVKKEINELGVAPTTMTSTPAPSSPAKSTTTSISHTQALASTSSKPSSSSTAKPKATTKKKAGTPATASGSSSAPNSKKGSAPSSSATVAAAKKGKSKGKTKVDELKASTKPRSSSLSDTLPPTPTTPTRGTGTVDSTPNPSPDKNAVYCICRKPYAEEEENITMLGCESCDNWFHPSCVGLTEDMMDLLDVYICKSCERNTHQRTIYKQVCKRDGCHKSVAGSVSKFCSPTCAFQHSHNLISGMPNKNTLKQLAKTFISYPPPNLGVNVTHHRPAADPKTNDDAIASVTAEMKADSQLADLQRQIDQVERAINLVKARQQILESAIVRCETLQPIAIENGHDEAEEEELVGKRGKKKKGLANTNGGGKDDKPCGWVRILVADDQRIDEWRTSEGGEEDVEMADNHGTPGGGADRSSGLEEGTCYNGRRKCDRHQGWQKTIAVLLEVELSGLERNHQNLVEYHDSLKISTESQQASDAVRSEFLQRKEGLR
ncbi:hypothetical protein IAT40_002283 [Kwoniella sp. CBS 6097]